MVVGEETRRLLIETVARRVIDHADELTGLDQAIGDGDHGVNMKRGFAAVLGDLDGLAAKPLPEALKAIGMALVMKVGGASGPLYGTLFMTLGKELPAEPGVADLVRAYDAAIAAVKARGKSDVGQKTMLDVLAPVREALAAGKDPAAAAGCRRRGDHPDAGDPRPRLVPRRALDRPYGPGGAVERADHRGDRRRRGARGMSGNVGIVIVSHSADVARGTADMVRQMVGEEVPVAFCGGDPGGGLGTNVEAIMHAIDKAWSDKGVAILVDLGGAETNSEMAIELQPPERHGKIVVCNAPIVEGAVMAATEASGGATLQDVKRTAEELSPA